MGASAPASLFLHHFVEKGTITPFPITLSIPLALHGVTMPSCGSGLNFPHPVEHTGTLTPPIVRRTSASHSAKGRYPVSNAACAPSIRAVAGAPHRRIGRVAPPLHAVHASPIYKGYALS